MAANLVRFACALAMLMHAGLALAQTPDGFSPRTGNPIPIIYSGSAIDAGSPVPISTVGGSPAIRLSPTNTSNVIVMFDIDAPFGPTNNTFSPILHWIVAVPAGTTTLAENQTSINATVPYLPPNPPAGSVPHRYIILELRNPNTNFEMPAGFPETFEAPESRIRFNVSGFIEAGGFQLSSATWFTVESANNTVPPQSAASLTASSFSGILIGLVSIVAVFVTSI
ncbi:hypothetical protein HJFPF1_02224 [Paramyrothecium foliicola]|nr:hypothetical protein HJFPF1_02224 [Paramyrothecium foliicola]